MADELVTMCAVSYHEDAGDKGRMLAYVRTPDMDEAEETVLALYPNAEILLVRELDAREAADNDGAARDPVKAAPSAP